MRKPFLFLWGLAGLLLWDASIARADVDLVTLPTREGIQLTIYNSEDITMVREQRLLTVKEGINRIQFTWANTLIDPTSIEFRILDNQDKVELIDTTFPAGRNDSLQWNIRSEMAGKITVEIRYFTSGIRWQADYVGIADRDETKLRLTGYVRIENNSGELYDNAQTRLVVGDINLVEKIADLATRPAPGENRYLDRDEATRGRIQLEFRRALDKAEAMPQSAAEPAAPGAMAPAEKPKQVVKEGLSEYFLFSIEGREDIQDNEPKRLVSLEVDEVPLECLYRLSDRQDGQTFIKFYRFKNEKLKDETGTEKDLPAMNNLGLSPLPDGQVRLFFEYANNDLAYVGGTAVKFIPIGDRVEASVGTEPSITMKRQLKDRQIANVVARQYERRVSDDFVEHYDLVDYDETFFYEEEIVSGKPTPAKIEVERRFDANVVLWSEDEPPADWNSNEAGAYVDLHQIEGRVERVDQNHVKYFLDMQPGEKRVVTYKVTFKRRKMGPDLNVQRVRKPL